ncbi:hypothetical protein K4K49_001486 [Colletotrichum sp. SAR 10_70]|nr:hypothetical protein K4K50_013179 [Colletotrichum sp. SAR 10_71]KAI8187493.1 hypothetical protein K4K51_008733 [Colletotrichum sp. SAR 10_75]KAI8200699.1 hypothetical protein K4K49_001486 [Colletotrichum sp. SAR 10_70]KAI8225468.1 hypothetical protein K4K54_004547 [Colletotrichum sp. SAR 10_86]KAJ5005529.1 hypothetical protein K4K48_007023 [Colletotrichum sp. SAR 10_66]
MIGADEVGKLAPEISHALRADGTGTMATVTPKDIADLIHGMSGKEHTYIVIDAIDEADEATRGALIEHLTPRKQQGNGISLLVTSRRCKDFDYLTEHFHKEEVFADETDIHLLVDHLFATKKSLGRLARTNSGLQPQVREAVTKASNRMFLAAKLQIAHLTPISDQRTLSEPPLNEEVLKLRHKLLEIGDVRGTIDEMYDKIWNRIKQPKKDMEEDARWAYWVLAWICLSPQSLGLSELREALARHPEQPMHLTRKDLDAQEMIKDICEGLVTFSEGSVPVLHKILENNQDLNSLDAYNRTPVVVALQEGNIDIMDTCLKRGAQVNLADTEGRRLLLQVAQREDGSRKVVQSIIRQNRPYLNVEVGLGSMRNIPLLMGCIAIAGLSPLGYFSPPVERAYRRVFQGGGLMDLYQKQRSDNILDAADCGDVEAIERLVRDQRMSILERDPQVAMLTALVAVESNQTNFLLALLDAGVNINVRNFEGNTLLHRATTRGNRTLVKGLLERNIDVKARNDYSTCLQIMELEIRKLVRPTAFQCFTVPLRVGI